MNRPPDTSSLRAAVWTGRALLSVRRQLRRSGFDGLDLPRPPRLPPTASRGVLAVLRRRPSTCLERALVLQRWRAAHGDPHDVIVGVRGRGRDFRAHAWLDDERQPEQLDPFRELRRVTP
jgi:transglutaminase superfamily protein